jgi:hypothetical protein
MDFGLLKVSDYFQCDGSIIIPHFLFETAGGGVAYVVTASQPAGRGVIEFCYRFYRVSQCARRPAAD